MTSSCPAETVNGGLVNGMCYGPYAVQVDAYGNPPANVGFSMWSNSASCWGIAINEPSDPNSTFWNAPLVTRGFSFGYEAPLTASGGILVSALNSQHAGSADPCPGSGASASVCVKWAMSVPGTSPQSAVNTATATYTSWDALIDIYFHDSAAPAAGANAFFDLQIYQMVMDFPNGGVPNWASFIVGTYTTKTIGGVTYLVSVNMGDPGTEGSSWVGSGGTLNSVSMFPLPTYPTTTPAGSGSYLWGAASVVHDVGGIIAWLSQTETKTVGGVSKTGIFDDAGNLLTDNVRKAAVNAPLISPAYYLTGLNPGYEVVLANPGTPNTSTYYPNNTAFTTTNLWVALPGETVGN